MSNALIPPRLNADGYPSVLYMVSTVAATGAFISYARHVWNEATSAYEFSLSGVDYVLEVSGGNWIWGTAGLSTTGPSSAGSPVGRYTPDDSGVRFDLVASPPPNANTAEVTLSPGAPGTNTAEVTLSPGAPGANTAEVTLSPGAPGANTAEVTLSPGAPGANTAEVTLSPGAPGANTAEVTLSPGAPGANTAEVTLSPGAPGALIPEV